jgi:hypothetical protein
MRTLIVFWSLGAAVLTAADPQVVVVEETGGSFVVPMTSTVYREVQKQVERPVNGRVEIQTVTEKVPVTETKYVVIDAKTGDFLDRAGRPMDPKAVAALLKKGTVLAISPDGTPVGPDLLKKNEQIQAILLFKKAKDEKGPAPKLGVLEKDRDGRFHVEVATIEQVPVQEARSRRMGDRIVVETVTVLASREYKLRHALADARITDLGGNPVDLKSLRPGSKVAVSANYKPVDPSHIHELKGVVAVVVPSDVPVP